MIYHLLDCPFCAALLSLAGPHLSGHSDSDSILGCIKRVSDEPVGTRNDIEVEARMGLHGKSSCVVR